jgi:hypothetical protein
MRNQFAINQKVDLIKADKFQESSGSLPTHFQVLEGLVQNGLIPNFYLELLNTLEATDKAMLSKKLLKIYLYAASKIEGKQLYNWLKKGSLPQETNFGESMSALSNTAKKIANIDKNRNKAIDKITSSRKRLELKSSKKTSEAVTKGTEKLQNLNEEYDNQKSIIEQILNEIETSLASGRKL